jgi:hypothetical protein
MASKLKKAIIFLLQPTAIIFGVAIFLLIYVYDSERRVMESVSCYDCGWDTRQAYYLLMASLGLLLGRLWCVIISLFASVKVIYSVGYVAFWSMAEVRVVGGILKESLRWTYEAHPEYFVEIIIVMVIGSYATSFIWRNISRRYLSNRTAPNNAMQPTAR